MTRPLFLLGWTYVAFCAWLVARSVVAPGAEPLTVTPVTQTQPVGQAVVVSPAPTTGSTGAEWFRRTKPYCNSVEITTVVAQSPAPGTTEGAGYHAACFALAGRIDDARRVIDKLPASQRVQAAAIVFEVGHPVADAGDDRSAGPIMELVVDYMPDHYMALYHAGMAEYMLGQRELATKNLDAFMGIYKQEDGWRSNARGVLDRMHNPATAQDDARRPREP